MYSFAFSLNGTTDLKSAFCSTTLADQQPPATLCIYLSTREPTSQQRAPWVQIPARCQQRERNTVHIEACKLHFSVYGAKLQLLPQLHLQQGDTITLTKQLRATFQHCFFTKHRIYNFLEKEQKNWIKHNLNYIHNDLFLKMFPLNCYLKPTHCKSEVVWFHLHLKWFL